MYGKVHSQCECTIASLVPRPHPQDGEGLVGFEQFLAPDSRKYFGLYPGPMTYSPGPSQCRIIIQPAYRMSHTGAANPIKRGIIAYEKRTRTRPKDPRNLTPSRPRSAYAPARARALALSPSLSLSLPSLSSLSIVF